MSMIKRYFTLAALVSVLALAGIRGTPSKDVQGIPASRTVEARRFVVKRVLDGDTFKIWYDGELTSVRLALVNCPEKTESGGAEATAAAKALIDGKYVTISFTDPEHRKRDHYGRLLCSAAVINSAGQEVDLETELVNQGVAIWRP